MIDRKEIRKEGLELAKNNLGKFWGSFGFIIVIYFCSDLLTDSLISKFTKCIFSYKNECIYNVGSIYGIFVNLFVSLITTFLMYGLSKIILGIIRGKDTELNDLFTYKKSFFKLFILNFIIELLSSLGYLLIVPGIIISLMYSLVSYVYVDNEGSIKETLRKSREMMKGHKWELFLIMLNFFLWILLSVFTLGLLFIIVLPYIYITEALYYEKLKTLKK